MGSLWKEQYLTFMESRNVQDKKNPYFLELLTYRHRYTVDMTLNATLSARREKPKRPAAARLIFNNVLCFTS